MDSAIQRTRGFPSSKFDDTVLDKAIISFKDHPDEDKSETVDSMASALGKAVIDDDCSPVSYWMQRGKCLRTCYRRAFKPVLRYSSRIQ